MKIRWKIFITLLLLVLPPLLLGRLYSVVETQNFGKTLSNQASIEFSKYAATELRQAVTLYSQSLSQSKTLMEMAVLLLSHEAERLLSGEMLAPNSIIVEEHFAGTESVIQSPSLPPKLTPPQDHDNTSSRPPSNPIQFLLPPHVQQNQFEREKKQLAGLKTLYSKLITENASTSLWCFTILKNGLMAISPPRDHIPTDFDPTRLLHEDFNPTSAEARWTLVRDPFTQATAITAFSPLFSGDDKIMGVTGITFPIDQLLRDDNLSNRWSSQVQSLLVVPNASTTHAAQQTSSQLVVVAHHNFSDKEAQWESPSTLSPLQVDASATATIFDSLSTQKTGALETDYMGVPSILAYKTLPQSDLILLVIIPREIILKQSAEAEQTIMDSVAEILKTTGLFVLASTLLVFILAYFGSRFVTGPIARLAMAATRLAAGDFQARASISTKDELGDLAQTFNNMVGQLRERIKLKDDLSLAVEVQQHLLPAAPQSCIGYDIAGTCIYSDETGGDYYDYLPRTGESLGVVIGDVTGHGIQAALLMASVRSFLRGQAVRDENIADMVTETNKLLSIDTEYFGRFVTLFALELSPQNATVHYVGAGHDPALLYRKASHTFEELPGEGVPLGIMPDWDYAPQSSATMESSDIIVLATDGVWESRNPKEELYGKSRLKNCIATHAEKTALEIVDAILHDVTQYRQGVQQADDITVVVVKRLPS